MYQFKKYCTGSKNNEPVQEQIVPKDKLNYNIYLTISLSPGSTSIFCLHYQYKISY